MKAESYGRLRLIPSNSRFPILPEWQRPNVGSRVLALTERRVVADWQVRFGHPFHRFNRGLSWSRI